MTIVPHSKPLLLGLALLSVAGCADERLAEPEPSAVALVQRAPASVGGDVAAGREIFRHETWGDEAFWTDVLHLHEVVQNAVDPVTALAVGLKVDAARLPPGFLAGADLTSPATTVELLRRDAVVGVKAKVTAGGRIAQLGITCALCHSTVDNAVAPGVGRRLDGWPNRDLNVGAIVALSPVLDAATKAVFQSWGPGRYDAYFNHDGKNGALLLPPAYGLRDPVLAGRGTTGRYRTTPLRGAWQHPPYFHSGSAATLTDVVAHYNTTLRLGLTAQQQADLVQFLKSL